VLRGFQLHTEESEANPVRRIPRSLRADNQSTGRLYAEKYSLDIPSAAGGYGN
jgi:hypothetical protein